MTSRIEKLDNGTHYFSIPEGYSLPRHQSNRRVLCTINSSVTFHCALMPKKEGGYYIYLGKSILKQLQQKMGEEIHFELKEDHSEFQFEFPEALKEVFRTDPDAEEKFNTLTDGNKRGIMYLVNQVKTIDKKIERSLRIAEKLKSGVTSPRLIMKK